MAALVQTYPQQTGSVTMLQTRPTSTSTMTATGPLQLPQQYGHGGPQQRNNGGRFINVVGGPAMYRGGLGPAPIQPYAFANTPSLGSPSGQWQLSRTARTMSTPSVPTAHLFEYSGSAGRRFPGNLCMSNLPMAASMGLPGGSRDDSVLVSPSARRNHASACPQIVYVGGPQPHPSAGQNGPAKVFPERYRRAAFRVNDSFSRGSNQHGLTQHKSVQPGPHSPVAVDDLQLYHASSREKAERMRRRSISTLDSADFPNRAAAFGMQKQPEQAHPLRAQPAASSHKAGEQKSPRLASVDTRGRQLQTGSPDSRLSSRSCDGNSQPSSPNCKPGGFVATDPPRRTSTPSDQSASSSDLSKVVTAPPRPSSSDAPATKRITKPSPLSRPMTMDPEARGPQTAGAALGSDLQSPAQVESPAVKQLAAIQKTGKLKSKTSRLRRAFSFGSAVEFKKAVSSEQDDSKDATLGPSKAPKDPTEAEFYDAEQARIAQKQEESGLGSSIYAGAKLFSGSIDNISISSTASSASIMIRKMGRGMKKGGRSLVGLFRPKSVIGVPAADASMPEATQAAVSMITVEAERERVNVNAETHTKNGTGYSRLDRNSIEARTLTDDDSELFGSAAFEDMAISRKSIIGDETERAEVLAAVRRGILKHANSPRLGEGRRPVFDVGPVPHVADSPMSSAPSTPNEETQQDHKRIDSVAIGSEDYFVSALRLRQDSKSAPVTPQGVNKRNATFNPRIVFHDTWPSQEYDRRGDIATCNRLTPMLAQQIKEELNSFKMEMEVHETSKIYTHFF